nr:MATE family efflux transporter [Spirochaetota bacterium]
MIKEYLAENTPIRKQIFIIAIPVMIQMLSEYILNITDTAFIGHYDVKCLSAITNALYPFFILLSLFFATSKGVTILIAQSIGANQKKEARRYGESAFLFNQIVSLVYFLFFLFFGKWFLSLIGSNKEILELSHQYISIISFQFLFMGFLISANSVFEGKGFTLPIMVVSLVKTLLNIFLDWCMIFGNLGFPELGIRGAAYATLISQAVGGVILIILVFFSKKDFTLRFNGIVRPNLKIYLKSIILGFPAGLDFMLWVLGQNALIFILNKYDPLASGFFGVFSLILSLTVNLYFGISVAALNLVGKATGAKDTKTALRAGNLCIFYSLLICLVIAILFVIFPNQIFGIFTKEIGLLPNLKFLMVIMAITTFPTAFNVVSGNAIRGTGDTMWMVITQIPGTILIALMSFFFIFVFKF